MAAPDGSRDHTVDLPTSVLAQVISLLPLRLALQCGILSKAWLAALREMPAYAVSLDFGPAFASGLSPEQYAIAVDRTLDAASTLDSLRIFFYPGSSDHFQHCVGSWAHFAASKNVRELELDMLGAAPPADKPFTLCRLPGQAFRSDRLSRLSLSLCRLSTQLDPLALAFLDTLCLRQVNVTDDTITAFLHSCRFLRTLKLIQCFQLKLIKISSPPRLSCLEIMDCVRIDSVEIEAPTLKSFYFLGHPFKIGQIYNLTSMEDVYVNTMALSDGTNIPSWSFLRALCHFTTLTVCDADFFDFVSSIKFLRLTFFNLRTLQFIIALSPMKIFQLRVLVNDYFLMKCNYPALESLFIEFILDEQRSWEHLKLHPSELPLCGLMRMCIKAFPLSTDLLDDDWKFFWQRTWILHELQSLRKKEDIAAFSNGTRAASFKMLECSRQRARRSSKMLLCRPEDAPLNTPHDELHTEVMKIYYSTCFAAQ